MRRISPKTANDCESGTHIVYASEDALSKAPEFRIRCRQKLSLAGLIGPGKRPSRRGLSGKARDSSSNLKYNLKELDFIMLTVEVASMRDKVPLGALC
jgi:hypothetical protein